MTALAECAWPVGVLTATGWPHLLDTSLPGQHDLGVDWRWRVAVGAENGCNFQPSVTITTGTAITTRRRTGLRGLCGRACAPHGTEQPPPGSSAKATVAPDPRIKVIRVLRTLSTLIHGSTTLTKVYIVSTMPGLLGIVFNNIDFTTIVLLTPTLPSIVTLACPSSLTLLFPRTNPSVLIHLPCRILNTIARRTAVIGQCYP